MTWVDLCNDRMISMNQIPIFQIGANLAEGRSSLWQMSEEAMLIYPILFYRSTSDPIISYLPVQSVYLCTS